VSLKKGKFVKFGVTKANRATLTWDFYTSQGSKFLLREALRLISEVSV